MIKNFVFSVLLLLPCMLGAQAPAKPTAAPATLKPTETLVLLNVTVTDMKDVPSIGDKLTFVGKTTKKKFSGVTDAKGKFSILLPKAESFDVLFQAWEKDTIVDVLDMPADAGLISFGYTFGYELAQTAELDIHFETAKAVLVPESFPHLDHMADLLKNKSSLKIELAGHTDSDGSDVANQKLSEARAAAAKAYLVSKGVPAARITSVGYGESKPKATNDTPEGKAQNRRTEVRVLSK